jgi:cell wall assembly regulator SMI1
MWIEIFNVSERSYKIRTPRTIKQINEAEQVLGHSFPQALIEFFLETNGVEDVEGYLDIVWSLEWLVKTNLEFRQNADISELYEPFDDLLLFSDLGNGDQIAFSLAKDETLGRIYRWDHEDDSRIEIAKSLRGFINSWMTQ